MGRKAMAMIMALQQMQTDYLLSEIVLHSHSPPTLEALRHKSPVTGSYFSVAPGITCACVTVPPFGLFVFVYDAAEHPISDSVTAIKIYFLTISDPASVRDVYGRQCA
jgi:hypothetical protein